MEVGEEGVTQGLGLDIRHGWEREPGGERTRARQESGERGAVEEDFHLVRVRLTCAYACLVLGGSRGGGGR